MFGQKEAPSVSEEVDSIELDATTDNSEVDSSNIFEELSEDSDIQKEVDSMVNEEKKDIFFYLSVSWKILQTLFWVLLLVFLIAYSYIYIQEHKSIKNSSILDPFCSIFLWDIPNEDTYCSSVAALNIAYTSKLSDLKKEQTSSILLILDSLYKTQNFTKTKWVLFLADKTANKLEVLNILEKFDDLKNGFDDIEKEKIQCYDIQISSDEIVSARCEAYSAWYESWIKWFTWDNELEVKGTSISVANSFINYIEKSTKDFTILDKQKIFTSENVIWDFTGFDNKTLFNIKLKYNSNNLSL